MLVLAATGIAALWLLTGVMQALRKRLSEHTVNWLWPESQSPTFRLACGIARLAGILAPSTAASSEFWARLVEGLEEDGFEDPATKALGLRREPLEWNTPDAAIAELHADLESGKTALDPVRFVLPLLTHAVRLRLRNGLALARHARTRVVLLLFAAVVGPIIGLLIAADKAEGFVRSLSRRIGLTRSPRRYATADSADRSAKP